MQDRGLQKDTTTLTAAIVIALVGLGMTHDRNGDVARSTRNELMHDCASTTKTISVGNSGA
jgi:hypothetical protein